MFVNEDVVDILSSRKKILLATKLFKTIKQQRAKIYRKKSKYSKRRQNTKHYKHSIFFNE